MTCIHLLQASQADVFQVQTMIGLAARILGLMHQKLERVKGRIKALLVRPRGARPEKTTARAPPGQSHMLTGGIKEKSLDMG